MAITDPKVLLFMIMTCSQLLGLSFVNFFPTWVSIFYRRTYRTTTKAFPTFSFFVYLFSLNTFVPPLCRIAATLGFSTTITLLMAAYVISVATLCYDPANPNL